MRSTGDSYKILFVCMGNICRSPSAEGIMIKLVERESLSGVIEIDSAGTIGFHAGHPADARMRAAASKRGYELLSRARQIRQSDLRDFDIILAMDEENYRDIISLAVGESEKKKVFLFCEFCSTHRDKIVPDPYYGGTDGFEKVLDLLEDGCAGLLLHAKERLGGRGQVGQIRE